MTDTDAQHTVALGDDRVEHLAGGASLPVPDGWEVLRNPEDGVAMVAVEPPRTADGVDLFRANLVLTDVPTGGLGFRDWQKGTDELLPRVLHDYLLLDLERRRVGGHEGGRRLAHHVSADGVSLTMEQWFACVAGVGFTLTATVDTWRYDEVADFLSAVADGLTLPAEDGLTVAPGGDR
ncbi:MAG: hypothetical protein ACRDYU_10610 [Actinomycetes bacterium]